MEGRRLIYWCRLCGKSPLPPRRTAYCSDTCAVEWSIRNIPAYARAMVESRDHGVCALCGLDTWALAKDWRKRELAIRSRLGEVGRRRYKVVPLHLIEHDVEWQQLERERRLYLGGLNTRWARNRASLWDMDHIIPVVEGGGQCGLDNLRTLCIPCHRVVTAELRRRLRGQPRRPVAKVVRLKLPSLKVRARAQKRRQRR